MTDIHPDSSLFDLLVLLTIREVNDNDLVASDVTILSILEVTSLVTGIDLNCPDFLNPDAINEACERLEAIGYISDKERKERKDASQDAPQIPSNGDAHTLTAEEYELRESAIRFGVDVMKRLSRKQYEALFELLLCRTVGRWEGWYEDESEVLAMVREKLPSSLAKAEHGQRIAETMREIWDRYRAR